MQVIYSLPGHLGMIYDMSFDPSERLFVTASADGTVKVWDLEWLHLNADGSIQSKKSSLQRMSPPVDSGPIAVLAHTSYVYSAKFHPAIASGHPVVLTGGFDGKLRIWDVGACTVLQTLDYHHSWINAIACSLDGTRIFSAAADGELFVCRWHVHLVVLVLTLWCVDSHCLRIHGGLIQSVYARLKSLTLAATPSLG